MAGHKRTGYKLATYQTSEGPRAGLVIGEDVFDAAKLTGKPAYGSVIGILADWKRAEGALKKAAAGAAKSRAKRTPLGKTKLLAPVPNPPTIFCAGANYADHAAAMARKQGMPEPTDPREQGLKPWFFIKAAHTITDPGTTIKAKHYAGELDWEIELAAVIGRPGQGRSGGQGARPMSPATPSPTTSRRAIAAAGPASSRHRSSKWTGPSTKVSTAPVRSGRGSCRQATSPIRRNSG